MTMMQKVQAKKSKKGFTLVELVIVIAILAILAAIAIPVITTTINSSKLSVMESDAATINMLLKEAMNNQVASISTTTYSGVAATDTANLKVEHVLKENNISVDLLRNIGGDSYVIAYSTANGGFVVSAAVSGTTGWTPIDSASTIAAYCTAAGLA